MTRLDPSLLEQAKTMNNFRSDEVLAVKMGRSSPTIRKWRRGESLPSAVDLLKLKKLTGRPLDNMFIEQRIAA